MNKNLIPPNSLATIIKKLVKNKIEKPEFIGGKPVILTFLQCDGKDINLQKIQMCTEKQVEQTVINLKNNIKFTHYSIIKCRSKLYQEKIFMSILMRHPILKTIQTKITPSWKGTNVTKKLVGITKWDLNKMKQKNDDVSILFNGIQYWHIPTIKQMLEEI